MPSNWWWGQLLSAPGKELIETELPADTFEMLMQVCASPYLPSSMCASPLR